MTRGWPHEPIRHSLASRGVETCFGKSKIAEFRNKVEEKPAPKELTDINWDNKEKMNLGNVIKLFWWCSIHDDFSWFEFDKAFDKINDILKAKMRNHFMFSGESQREFVRKEIEIRPEKVLPILANILREEPEVRKKVLDCILTDKIKEDLKEKDEIRGHSYDTFMKFLKGGRKFVTSAETLDYLMNEYPEIKQKIIDVSGEEWFRYHDEKYEAIKEAYNQTKRIDRMTTQEKIVLFDKVIDMQHHWGGVLDRHLHFHNPIQAGYHPVPYLRKEFEEEYL